MIPQIGFAEMVVLVLLAIIVIGPKDLPKVMRSMGQFMAKIRSMGNEFKQAFEDMGAEEEIAEMRREIEELKKVGRLDTDVEADLAHEMRSLDSDIRGATDMSSPKASPSNTSPSNTSPSNTSPSNTSVPKKNAPKPDIPDA